MKKIKYDKESLIDDIANSRTRNDFTKCIHSLCILYENGYLKHKDIDEIGQYIIESCFIGGYFDKLKFDEYSQSKCLDKDRTNYNIRRIILQRVEVLINDCYSNDQFFKIIYIVTGMHFTNTISRELYNNIIERILQRYLKLWG